MSYLLCPAWLALAHSPCIGYWIHSLIFRLVVFSMHQKEESEFPVLLCNHRILSKKASYAANTKKARNEDVLYYCFKTSFQLLLKFSFLLTKVLQFLKIEAVLRYKKEIIFIACYSKGRKVILCLLHMLFRVKKSLF